MLKPVLAVFSLIILSVNASAQLPAGAVADYTFDNSANDISGNNYNGTLTSTSATSNRFGNANKATAFTAGVSTGTLPLGLVTALQNNFTIGYWFKTNMTASSSTQWYGGNAMVDAEVCGGTADWGTALINGGQVCFGTGNPDITVISASNYNDNLWHFVTAVRNMTATTMTLYVDGIQVGFSAGTNTGVLNAPGFIGLGRNFCSSSAKFTGSLDDIIAYNRALSGAEVTNLYNFLGSFILPIKWVSFTGEVNAKDVSLNWKTEQVMPTDRFEVEYSSDAIHFAVIATVPGYDGSQSGEFHFVQSSPGSGIHYYRIRQVDKDGNFSYSSTIKLTVRNSTSDPYLLSNPVGNQLVLANPGQQMIRQLVMMDLSGRVAKKWELNSDKSTLKLNVPDLLPGYYVIQVNGADGRVLTLPCIH